MSMPIKVLVSQLLVAADTIAEEATKDTARRR